MILELPPEVQMAIKLRAVKTNQTTGRLVEEAIRAKFPVEIGDAREALAAAAPQPRGVMWNENVG